nr:hypothetical protein [Tanacetum cinerariifolium]
MARISVRAYCLVNPPSNSPPFQHFSPPSDYQMVPPSTPHDSSPPTPIAPPRVMSTSTHPIIILSDSDIEDAFSSINTPDYTPDSPDYTPASPRNTASNSETESDPSEDPFKDHSAPLAISPFHDDPYMKVMQAYNATSN